MARYDPDEFRGVARQRPRGKDAVRPVGAASVKLGLICAVRIHVEHNAREAVRQVDVFPAQVHNAPVVHNDGVPVVVLFDRELANRAVELLNIEIADVAAAVNAGHARHARGGAEDHAVVGEIAAVVIIDVGVVNEGRKFGLLLRGVPVFVERELPEPPAVGRQVGRREHNFRRVVVEFQVADEFAVCRLIDEFIFALAEVKAAEFVAVARLRKDGIAVVVFRQAHLIRIAANVQERGEVQVGRAEYDVKLKGIVVGLERGDLFVEAVFFAARDRVFDFLGAFAEIGQHSDLIFLTRSAGLVDFVFVGVERALNRVEIRRGIARLNGVRRVERGAALVDYVREKTFEILFVGIGRGIEERIDAPAERERLNGFGAVGVLGRREKLVDVSFGGRGGELQEVRPCAAERIERGETGVGNPCDAAVEIEVGE